MFCSNCGKEIDDKACVCIGCGVSVKSEQVIKKDSASALWWWLGFICPFAGLLIWICCHDSTPIMARKAGIGAIVSTVLSVVSIVLLYVFVFAFVAFWEASDLFQYTYYI